MAAKAKVTPEQWELARAFWEKDPRKGYSWLVDELKLPVSADGVRKEATRKGWKKQDSNDLKNVNPLKDSEKNSIVREKDNETDKDNRADNETDKAKLKDKEEFFVREYLVDLNATQAAIRAGYTAKSASSVASKLLAKPHIREAVEQQLSERARKLGIDADELLKIWAAIVNFDVNEIVQLRRYCCPYCYGKDHQKQYTPAGLEAETKRHNKERARRLKDNPEDDIGEFPEYSDAWYDKKKPPVENCPECFGDGMAEIYHADTRTLSATARLVYCGVKDGKDGIEFLLLSKEKALENLAKALGLFREPDTNVTFNMVSKEELAMRFEEIRNKARERQASVLAERGIVIDGEINVQKQGK
ncbi:MAG: terminase small subunit [Alistipes senegalensis]|nr:terminase small subunit [Oxalobacter formigenes]MCM1280920.1 terminase small subunit [Alistipes senegalensis]